MSIIINDIIFTTPFTYKGAVNAIALNKENIVIIFSLPTCKPCISLFTIC